MIVEGCYIPFRWRDSFSADHLRDIRHVCLVMTERYIRSHWQEIRAHACDIEQRGDEADLSPE